MIAAIYARKSTEQTGFQEEGKSVTRQIEHARAYAEKKGWSVAEDHIYSDDGISGAEFVKRPGFLRLMNALKPTPPFQVLVMSEESRLGREAIETSYTFKQVIDSGVRVFFYLTDQERTLDNALDKVMLSLTNFAAELEREKASQRTHDALHRKAKALYVTGNKVFGYDNVPVYGDTLNTDGTPKRQHVVRRINPEQAKIVVRIFESYASGIGLTTLAKTLNHEHLMPPNGGRLGWCPTAIRDMLRRDLYRGVSWWNRTQMVHRGGTRKLRQRPQSEWLRVEAPELRIISDGLWEQVAERHRRNEAAFLRSAHGRLLSRPTGEDQRSAYLLSGLAKCVVCGGSIVACKNINKRLNRRGAYQCALNHKRGTAICSNNVRLPLDILDSAILHAMNAAIDERVLEASVVTALDRLRAEQDSYPDQRLTIQRELSLIEARCRRLLDLMGDGKGNPLMVKELDGLAARQDQLKQDLQRLEEQTQVVHLDAKRVAQDLRRRLSDLPSLFARHVPQARQMLRKLLDGHILCEPILEDGKAGYRFSATGTFDRLLTGKRVVSGATNYGGCGERI